MSAGSWGPSGIVLGREIFGDLWQAVPAGGEDPSPHLLGREDRERVPVSAGCQAGFPLCQGPGCLFQKCFVSCEVAEMLAFI